MGFGGSSGGGSGSISASTDVALNNPTNKEVLSFDSATSKWKNTSLEASDSISPAVQAALDAKVPQSIAGQPGRFRGMYTTLPETLPSPQIGDWIIVYGDNN